MAKYLGNYAPGDIIDFKFTTFRPSTGAPFTLAGTPAVSIYKSNSTTETTTGVTLSVDFDSRTGAHNVRVDTSADGTFYSSGGQFEAMITAGTVDSVSMVGACIGRFTLGVTGGLATAAALDTVDNFLDTEIAAIKAVTDLFVAAHAEPTGVPAADETPLDKLAYLFMALRNRVDVTATKKIFYDDGGSAEWEKDLSDDGTTYTETEGNAP